MEGLLFIALVGIGVLLLGVVMYGLRFESERRRPPVWLLAVLLMLDVAMLIVAVTFASWWNVVTFLMLTAVSGALLIQGLRARRST